MSFFLSNALYLSDTFKSFGASYAATYAVDGVGGEDDHAAVGQAFQYHLDIARIGVRGIEFQ